METDQIQERISYLRMELHSAESIKNNKNVNTKCFEEYVNLLKQEKQNLEELLEKNLEGLIGL